MEEFYIDCDGIRLHAKLDKPEGADRCPLCILIHGFTGNMEEEHLTMTQKAMNDAGVAVLRAEMYGHGGSDGEFRTHTLYKWVTNALAVTAYAKKLDFVTDLYLCGHSQGGLLTMLVGGMCADDFKAIIPMSPAWMIPECARQGTLLGTDFDPQHIPDVLQTWEHTLDGDYIRVAQTIHVEDEIARYNGPVLIVHGASDSVVPYDYVEKATAMYKNAKLIAIAGADHCYGGYLDELYTAIYEFFAKMK